MLEKFQGIFTALVTPMHEDGSIDEASLRQLIGYNLRKGVSGFYVDGSTAEAFLLTQEERKKIIEIACDACRGKCTVMVHVGSISTQAAIDLAKHAEKSGADAISSVPPFYYGFSFDEIAKYYEDITKSVSLPMIVYNIPAFSGVSLSMKQFERLLSINNIIGVKFTSKDLFLMERIKRTFPNKLVFNGYDEIALSGLVAGADGAIGSTYNVMAEKFVKIFDLVKSNRIAEAKLLQQEANDIIDTLIETGVFQGEKELLHQLGVIKSATCRAPFLSITKENAKKLEPVAARLEAM